MSKLRKTCTECGTENNIRQKYCPQCGATLPPLSYEQQQELFALRDRLISSLENAIDNYLDVVEQNSEIITKALNAFSNHHRQLIEKPRLIHKKKYKETSKFLLDTIVLISMAMPSPEPGNIEKKLEVIPGCRALAQICVEIGKTSIDLRNNYLIFLDNQQMVYQAHTKVCLQRMASLFSEMADEVEKNR